jgi:hypothetical protein
LRFLDCTAATAHSVGPDRWYCVWVISTVSYGLPVLLLFANTLQYEYCHTDVVVLVHPAIHAVWILASFHDPALMFLFLAMQARLPSDYAQ